MRRPNRNRLMRMWMKRNQDGSATYHRLDGPAVEWDDGSKEWWNAGQEVLTIQELAGYVQRLEREVFYLTKKVEELSK